MEERQPEKRNDRNNRNNRHRNRNRGNRDGGPRQGGNRENRDESAKPGEIMAYVDEIDNTAPVTEAPVAAETRTPDINQPQAPQPGNSGRPDAARPDRNAGRNDNNRQRDSNRPDGGRNQQPNNRDRSEAGRNENRDRDRNRPDAARPDAARDENRERQDTPRPERNENRNRNDRDRDRGRDRDRDRENDRGRERDRDTERDSDRPARPEPVSMQAYDREDELRPSDPRPGESRLGEMRVSDLAGRGADVAPEDRLVVGISLGDYNGIGPEVILKALRYNQLQRVCTPVIYGSMRVLNRYRNLLNLKDWNLNGIQNIEQVSHKMTNVITCYNENARVAPSTSQPDSNSVPAAEVQTSGNEETTAEAAPVAESEPTNTPSPAENGAIAQAEATPQPAAMIHEIQPGKVTPEAGQAALACLERAVEDLKAGKIDALITGPINKHNIQSETFKFPGHTEYLAQAFGVPDDLMFMVGETLRVGVVTGHVPLGRVRQNVTRNAIHQKLTMMMQSLKVDFGIEKPRIAVLGLNPHAGENGLLGNEEQETIIPVIEDWRKKGELVYGPFPADGFFGTRGYRKYDAVLAMYHDQGLIPFKAIAFDEGVNFTAGLPIVRTSPDHGTAYDIAGKNLADENSMTQAIYLACDVARRRKEHQETQANALKK